MADQRVNPKDRQHAYKQQEASEGSLSEKVRAKIQELIKAYDPINQILAKSELDKTTSGRDPRLPIPGTVITKTYKGQAIWVKVLENGFEYQGQIYKNLSSIATAITGDHWNGFIFFGLNRKK